MKFRRLPLATPVVPPEERTIARSSGLAAHGKASLPCSLAMLSSRTEAPATLTPTDAILAEVPAGTSPVVCGNTTRRSGAICATSSARRSEVAGSGKYTAAEAIRFAAYRTAMASGQFGANKATKLPRPIPSVANARAYR